MSDLVCAICASKNAKNLINIDTGQLRNLYDIVCGIKTQFINALPSYICLLCVSHLTKFYNVQNQFRTGLQTTLQLKSLIEQDPDNNYVIDRSEVTIHPALSHSDPDKMKYIEMKHRTYTMFRLKPQNDNATSIHSFHIHIDNTDKVNYNTDKVHNNTDKVNDANKIEFISEDNQQNACQDEDNKFNNVSTDSFNYYLNCYAPTKNLNFKIDLSETPTTDYPIESLAKILPIGQRIRSLETFMNIKLLKPNEAKAVNELWAHIMNRSCGKVLKDNVGGNVDIHKVKHEESKFSCNICFKTYLTYNMLQRHCIDVHIFKYICRICDDVLFKFSDARSHLRWVHNKTLNDLGEVNWERERAYSDLESHFKREPTTPQEATEIMLKSSKSRKHFKCDVCMIVIKNEALLKLHQQKHVVYPGQVQCDICKYTYSDKNKMRRHYKYQHYWKYSCKYCNYVTTVRNMACTHKLLHLRKGENVTYNCEYCDKSYKKGTSLATHARFAHPCNAICNICGESYTKYTGVRKHIKMTHTEQELELSQVAELNPDPSSEIYCKECEVQFINQDGFDKHLRSSGKHTAVNMDYRKKIRKHTSANVKERRRRMDIKPRPKEKIIHNCRVCGLVLNNIVLLRYHYHRYHRTDPYYQKHLKREYKCDLCEYTTPNQSAVYTHKKLKHTSIRPFICQQCGLTFKTKGNMTRHLIVHTQERPFECPQCKKRFAAKSTVNLHIQTVHLKIPYPPWQNKNKRNREKRQEKSGKTTNKRKKSSKEVEPQSTEWVEQEVVEDSEFYLEAQELATDYIMKDNLVYSTTSRDNRELQSSYVISNNEP